MIRYRWLVPLALAITCLVLILYVRASEKRVVLSQDVRELRAGETMTLRDVHLVPGVLYAIEMAPAHGVPLGRTATVEATLFDEEAGELLVLEDSYWHERGVWREGGESGTWQEANAATQFDFRVPTEGDYVLEVGLYESNMGAVRLGARVVERHYVGLAQWPLGAAAFVLLISAIWAARQRNRVTAMLLAQLGKGSRVRIESTTYEVVDVVLHEELDGTGVELRLRSSEGIERSLAIESFEEEWVDSEGEDRARDHLQILMEVEIGPSEAEAFEARRRDGTLRFRGVSLLHDRNNSGRAGLIAHRDGEQFTSRYDYEMYRGGSFPKRPDQWWIERAQFDGRDEPEWAVMRIVDWSQVQFLESHARTWDA